MKPVIQGDIWNANLDITIVATNGVLMYGAQKLVMGAGSAKQAMQLYPDLPYLAYNEVAGGKYHRVNSNTTWLYGYFDIEVITGRKFIGFFQTKFDYNDKADLALIGYSVIQLNRAIENISDNITIGMVMPGVGLGGLKASVVLPVLETLNERVKVFQNKIFLP